MANITISGNHRFTGVDHKRIENDLRDLIDSLEAVCDIFKQFGKSSRIRLACGCPACCFRCTPAPLTAHIAEGVVEESAEIKYDSRTDNIVHLGFNGSIGISELEGSLEDCGRGQAVSLACPAFKNRCGAVYIF